MQCTRFKHQRRHSKHNLDSVLYPEMAYPPANCLKPCFPQRHHAWRDPSLGWSSLGDHLQTLVKLQIERKTKTLKSLRSSAWHPLIFATWSWQWQGGGILKWTSPESGNWAPLELPFVNFVTVGTVKSFLLPFRIVKFPTSLKPRKKNQLSKNTQFAFPFLFRDPFPFLLSGQFFEAVNWAWLFLGLQG